MKPRDLLRRVDQLANPTTPGRPMGTRAEMWRELLALMREQFTCEHGREPTDEAEFQAWHAAYDLAHPIERAAEEIAALEAELAARAARR